MQDTGFIQASRYLGTGLQLVKQPGLRRFVLVPLAINIAVFAGLGMLTYGWVTGWLAGWSFFEQYSNSWFFLTLQSILQFIIGFILFVVFGYAFTLLANLIGAPFNSLLSERVEQYLTGSSPNADPSMLFLIKSIPKTLGSEISKLIYLALWMIPLLILGFVPVINIIMPFVLFAFGAWMYALEYLDYPLGNLGHGFKQVKSTLKSRRRLSLGFGSMVALFSIVPVVNLVIMPVAVAGATALYVDKLREDVI